MGRELMVVFTITSGFCTIFLLISFIHFILRLSTNKRVDPLVKKLSFISLFGYTLFVFISFIFYLLQSIWYIPSINIKYSIIICQLQTFNIVFFMMGKLSMYFFFMSLIHVTFRDSFLEYPPKIIASVAVTFFSLMCIIGGFYMTLMYMDFASVHSISSPSECQNVNISKYTTATIWTGATCDALWSFTCLFLFCFRLRKLTNIMRVQERLEREEIAKTDYIFELTATTVSENNQSMENRSYKMNQTDGDTCKNEEDGHMHETRSSVFSDQIKLGNVQKIKKRKKKASIIHKFLPITQKLSILSAWCALSTFGLAFGVWTIYPTLSSVIDSTINSFCVYLSFGFADNFYQILCSPFISCNNINCENYRNVVKEVKKMENSSSFSMENTVLG